MSEWVKAEDKLPPDGELVLCWYEYFRFGSYNRMFQTFGIGCQYAGNWCCKICNRAKNNMDQREFIEWARKVTNYTVGRPMVEQWVGDIKEDA